MNILVLDDDEAILAILNKHLSEHVSQLFKSQTISSAINYVKMNKVDICIVDVNLEVASGLDFIEQINSLNKNCRSIVCSGEITEEIKKKATSLGVSDFIIKPFDFHDLIAAIVQKE